MAKIMGPKQEGSFPGDQKSKSVRLEPGSRLTWCDTPTSPVVFFNISLTATSWTARPKSFNVKHGLKESGNCENWHDCHISETGIEPSCPAAIKHVALPKVPLNWHSSQLYEIGNWNPNHPRMERISKLIKTKMEFGHSQHSQWSKKTSCNQTKIPPINAMTHHFVDGEISPSDPLWHPKGTPLQNDGPSLASYWG